jgi:primary-amine oxidase
LPFNRECTPIDQEDGASSRLPDLFDHEVCLKEDFMPEAFHNDSKVGVQLSRRVFLQTSARVAGFVSLPNLLDDHAPGPEASTNSARSQTAGAHPLDPLTAEEIAQAVGILKKEKQLGESFRFVSITLLEPPRSATREHKAGSHSPERQAFLVIMDVAKRAGYEAIVDLTRSSVGGFTPIGSGLQPAVILDEFGECEEAVKRSPEFLSALKKRGVTDVNLVMVEPWSAGYYGTEIEQDKGRRLLRALCFVRSEPTDNGFARPLDGVIAVVDLHKMEVVRIEDHGVVPLPPESGNWARQYVGRMRQDLKPLEIVQRQGPSFKVNGREVSWQKWKVRIGFTPREGLVLHTVSYNDDGQERPVLHRAALCEMVVPYGDPGEQYYRKNAFDIGEYGIGTLANSLALGHDCLGTVKYFDAPMVDSRGRVVTIKNAICLHEEDYGLLWKHTDWRTSQTEVRRSRRLSLSFVATVGNYEYGFFWYLYQDGSLQCEIKLTGIMNTTALKPGQKPDFGVEVAPQLNAPLHQHIFAARLDMNVDGPKNSVYEVNMVSLPRGGSNSYGNAFRAESTLLTTEQQARRSVNTGSARFWRVVNPNRNNRLGQPVSYRLIPGENCPPFVQPDAAVMRRAGFVAHHLWVTPFSPVERYAAGDYPNQNPGIDGLPKWTVANRSIENTEVVLWYVFGHNHVPRPEDWPVMPAACIGFQLKPDGFFTRNPALDVPPSAT